MRSITTGFDYILDLAFQVDAPALAILGESGRDQACRVAPLNEGTMDTRLIMLARRGNPALSANGRRVAFIDWQYNQSNPVCLDLISDQRDRLDWISDSGRLIFSPDCKNLFIVEGDSGPRSAVIRWSIGADSMLRRVPSVSYMFGMAAHPDGRRLACCNIERLDIVSFSPDVDSGQWHIGLNASDAKFACDGKTLALAAGSNVVLWDPQSGQQRLALIGHEDRVMAMAFTPDGRRLATAGSDHCVKLWNVADGRLLRTYRWPINGISALAFSHDGLTAAAGSNTGDVLIWDMDHD
jgi:hypothetical protein